jgi:hypothetical protein
MVTCFDAITEGLFGSLGDLLLIPDQDTSVELDFEDGVAQLPGRFKLQGAFKALDWKYELWSKSWTYCQMFAAILRRAMWYQT